jgi:phosphate transport system substrate-binding protein
MTSYRNCLWTPIVLWVAVISGTAAGDGATNDLRGPAFSDPNERLEQREDWLARPIHHGKWAEDADIALVVGQGFELLLPIIQDYARSEGVDVAVKEGRCGNSRRMLGQKTIDIGGFCCPPATSDRLPGVRFHTIGVEPLAILVHEDNPVEDLTIEQVQAIFQGKARRWSEFSAGGEGPAMDLPIRPVVRLHCKARPGHWRLILDNEDLFSRDSSDAGTTPDMVIASVAQYSGAIGYETLNNLGRFDSSKKLKAVKIAGISPDDIEALAAGKYPFYRVHNLTTWDTENTANPKAGDLVRHIMAQMDAAGFRGNRYHVVSPKYLRQAGWKFQDDEVTGAPN